MTESAPSSKTGLWLLGARGGVSTTTIVGQLAIARGVEPATGLVTDGEPFASLPLPPLSDIVIGGHEIRDGSLADAAAEIRDRAGTFSNALLDQLAPDLAEVDARIRPGVLVGDVGAIEEFAGAETRRLSPSAATDAIAADLEAFRSNHSLGRVVVVNLTSTEPFVDESAFPRTAKELEERIAQDDASLPTSTIYAVAAARAGCGFVHFTPSVGARASAVLELFESKGLPIAGCDGKTGETLVKSALAPMFAHRNLQVLSWQGYNMLGDRDGEILAHDEHKESKVESKDQGLRAMLGYPFHSKVAIDYVPSLDDWKTAWDFIHFRGFLGVKMSMQFTWQGCDSILAAPLILDLTRFVDLALRRGESGVLPHLAAFFKSPFGTDARDLATQTYMLVEYVGRVRKG